ncbi:MAG: hypothetical protein J6V50_05035 [Clostridia bacterium]|nr:hypothetical protein [Clostridia bacterium]
MRKRSNKKLRITRLLAFLIACVILLGSVSIYIEFRLRDVAVTFARNAVSSALSSAINIAALRLIKENGLTYEKVASLGRDSEGRVTSAEIDTNEINSFKASLAEEVQKELARQNEITVKVPLLAAFGIYYTYLSYPKISYTLGTATIVSSNYKSEFYDAGINQVLHRISVVITTAGNLALPGHDEKIEEITDFTVAETVIVGAVPEAFTNIDYANEDVVDDVFDYGAQKP